MDPMTQLPLVAQPRDDAGSPCALVDVLTDESVTAGERGLAAGARIGWTWMGDTGQASWVALVGFARGAAAAMHRAVPQALGRLTGGIETETDELDTVLARAVDLEAGAGSATAPRLS